MTSGAAFDDVGTKGNSSGQRATPVFLGKLAALTTYTAVMLTSLPKGPHPGLDAALRWPRRALMNAVNRVADHAGLDPAAFFLRQGAFFTITMLVIPWLVLACLRRGRPGDLGWRRSNAFGPRLLGAAYAFSLPFIVWMAASPTFRPYYESQLKRGATGFLAFYAVTMIGEHFLFHGVILAVLYPGARWPGARAGRAPGGCAVLCTTAAAAPDGSNTRVAAWRRAGRWLGVVNDRRGATGWRGLMHGLGIPVGGEGALLASGALFALIHWGKDPRELLLSLPGGVASAYLAFRTDTLVTPMVLHMATAGTAYALMTAWA